MPFNSQQRNPVYQDWLPIWTKLGDCFDGEEAVKARGDLYLPTPTGFAKAPDPSAMLKGYMLRAQVPELMAPTVRGLAGVIHRKPATYDATSIAAIIERATSDGMTLDGFHRRVTRNVLTKGRFGILTDAPAGGGDPYLSGYPAEAIVDWETDDAGKLTFLALDETRQVRDANGVWQVVERYRVLELIDGKLVLSMYETKPLADKRRRRPPLAEEALTMEPTLASGENLDFIPFTFINTNDLTPDPDDAPLAGVANAQLSIYRLDADYRHALYLTSQPTPYAAGIDPENAPTTIGSATIWLLPEGGSAGMVEFTGAGIEAMRNAMRDDYDKAVAAGAQLIGGGQQGQAESGDALRLRYGNQTATITTISLNVGAGIEQALRFAATMKGANADAIKVDPNLDFVEQRLSANDLNALVNSWLKGAISKVTMFDNLQRGQIVPESRTFEDEEELIAEEAPDLVPGNQQDDGTVDPNDGTGGVPAVA